MKLAQGLHSHMSVTIGVSIVPGQIAFDSDPSWRVLQRSTLGVSPIIPCFEAWYGARPGSPTRPPSDEQLTMAPLPWARIWASSCFMQPRRRGD